MLSALALGEKGGIHLIAADAGFEIEIRNVHFLKTKRAFGVFLQSSITLTQ
jgi:hypothetical protein